MAKKSEILEEGLRRLGGKGSGHHGHAGIPGQRGGSASRGAMGPRSTPMGDGRFDKLTHSRLAGLAAKEIGGSKAKGSGHTGEVRVKGSAGRKNMEKWVQDNGFESFKDLMKTDVFYGKQKGISARNGKFLVEVSSNEDWSFMRIIDMQKAQHPMWQGAQD